MAHCRTKFFKKIKKTTDKKTTEINRVQIHKFGRVRRSITLAHRALNAEVNCCFMGGERTIQADLTGIASWDAMT